MVNIIIIVGLLWSEDWLDCLVHLLFFGNLAIQKHLWELQLRRHSSFEFLHFLGPERRLFSFLLWDWCWKLFLHLGHSSSIWITILRIARFQLLVTNFYRWAYPIALEAVILSHSEIEQKSLTFFSKSKSIFIEIVFCTWFWAYDGECGVELESDSSIAGWLFLWIWHPLFSIV